MFDLFSLYLPVIEITSQCASIFQVHGYKIFEVFKSIAIMVSCSVFEQHKPIHIGI